MPRLSKEEQRIEKIIRGLLKLPENKKCINCNSLGPQYVCTTFWTFVCTSCSGIHREFTHRVKSVSMATFSMEEVKALQAGGNERAREVYFKTLDEHRNPIPNNSNLHRVREFIKHVYVDRKYTSDSDQLAMVKRDAIDDSKDKHSGTERSNKKAEELHLGHSSSAPSFQSRDLVLRQNSRERHRSARDAFLEHFSNGPFSERPKEGTRELISHQSYERPRRGARDDFLGRPSSEKPRLNARSDFSDRLSFDTPSRGVRDDFLERHSFENSSPGTRHEFPERSPSKISLRKTMSSRNSNEEGRSPSKQEDAKSGGPRSRRPQFEIVDDRFRDDNNGSVKHYESIRYSNRHSVSSPDSSRQRDTRKPLAICSPKEALDKKVPSPNDGESIKTSDEKCSPDSPAVQKEEGDPNQEEGDPNQDSTTGKELETDQATTTDLLDSDPTPETTSTIDNDEGEKTVPVDEGEKKTPSIDNGEAPSSTINEDSDAKVVTSLELLDWTTPSNTTPEDSTCSMSNIPGSIPSDLTSSNQGQTDLSLIEAPLDSKNDLSPEVEQGAAPVIADTNQSFAPATNYQGSLATDHSHSSPQANSQQPPETTSNNEVQNYNQALVIRDSNESQNSKQAPETSGSHESQSSTRKELPMDLFAGSYPSFPVRGPVPIPVAVPGWQPHPHHRMGYGMQYPPVQMYTPPFTASAASRNPFDIGSDATQMTAPNFPHMPPAQGAQHNMIAPTGYHNQESSHAFSWQPQRYPYGMATAPGAFQGPEVPYDAMNSSNAHAIGSINHTQQLTIRDPTSTTPNFSSTSGRGNPFG